jgi:hypothetical protein
MADYGFLGLYVDGRAWGVGAGTLSKMQGSDLKNNDCVAL